MAKFDDTPEHRKVGWAKPPRRKRKRTHRGPAPTREQVIAEIRFLADEVQGALVTPFRDLSMGDLVKIRDGFRSRRNKR